MIILFTSNEQCLETTTTANIIEVNTYTTDTSLTSYSQSSVCSVVLKPVFSAHGQKLCKSVKQLNCC